MPIDRGAIGAESPVAQARGLPAAHLPMNLGSMKMAPAPVFAREAVWIGAMQAVGPDARGVVDVCVASNGWLFRRSRQ